MGAEGVNRGLVKTGNHKQEIEYLLVYYNSKWECGKYVRTFHNVDTMIVRVVVLQRPRHEDYTQFYNTPYTGGVWAGSKY